ncbi:hypothetical protein E4U14_006166 [Claviceps sp. LM454 group G7]|nr:hypothetical protein E4U14_006166 [Claviceps sp. LM454 group G7]
MSTAMMLRSYAYAPAALDLWPIAEDSLDQRQALFPTPAPTVDAKADLGPMYPGLQTPKMDRTPPRDSVFLDPRPRYLSVARSDYARPRKSLQVQEPPVRFRKRTSSRDCRLSGYFPVDSPYPPLGRMSYVPIRTPPILKNHRNSRAPLGDQCSALPGEVLDVILEMLKEIHLDQGSEGCATCWMRDVSSVALCSRKWYKAARLALYQDIQLTGPDSTAHKKKFKFPKDRRLALLRRTLRADADIASIVRSLKVPTPEIHTVASSSSDPKAQALLEQYEDQVASLVVACPNLERLTGPVFTYDYSFKRLFQALETRGNLKDMDWVLDAAAGSLPSIQQQQQHAAVFITKDSQNDALVPYQNQLHPNQEDAFLKHNKTWTKLASLSIQCLPGAPLTQTLLSRTLSLLPSLQHLHLHDLPRSAFTDGNLAALPPLKSLTLSNIRGISSNGLSAFATRPNSQTLRELTLRHTPLTSLPALARILSNLHSLANLSFVQSFSPLMPDSNSFVLCMMPYLASSSITNLHWDITSHHASRINPADDILAQSIAAGGFPSLRLLRVPNDPDGLFQQLCRPVARISLPGDRLRHRCTSISDFEKAPSLSSSASRSVSAASPPTFLVKSSTTSSLPSIEAPVPHSSLASARLAAQARLDRARQAPRIQVNVTDEHGGLVERFGLAGYMGTLGSRIEYHLLPDLGSTDEQGGLAGCRAGGNFPNRQTRGCVGCESSLGRGIGGRKKEGRWWCAARGRWRGFCDH